MNHTPIGFDDSLLLHADNEFELHLGAVDGSFQVAVLDIKKQEYVDFDSAPKLKVNFGDYRADRAPYDKHESFADDLIAAKDFVEDYLTKLPKQTAESIKFLCDEIYDAAKIAEHWRMDFGRRIE